MEALIRSDDLPIETENVDVDEERPRRETNIVQAAVQLIHFAFIIKVQRKDQGQTNLFDKPAETNENLKHVFVQIREKEGDQYCKELELDKKRSMSSLLELVREEYQLGASEDSNNYKTSRYTN